MKFEDYYKNNKTLFNTLADEVNANSTLQNSFQAAIEQVSAVSKYRELLGITEKDGASSIKAILDRNSGTQRDISKLLPANAFQTAVVGKAFHDNFKFEGTANLLNKAYESLFERSKIEEEQSSISAILENDFSFSDRLKPDVYIRSTPVDESDGGFGATLADSARLDQNNLPGAMSGLSTLTKALSLVDRKYNGAILGAEQISKETQMLSETIAPSWLKEDSPWKTAIDKVTNLGKNQVQADTTFMRLINAECETGKLLDKTGIDTSLTSAAAQLASIFQTERLRNMSSIGSLLSSYSDFALNQHKLIQKALGTGRNTDAEWRLGLLDTTSKFVDRQIIWGNDIAEDIYSSTMDADEANYETITNDDTIAEAKTESESDAPVPVFTTLPRDLGYSNREDSDVTVEHAFGKSKLVTITEIGKAITDGIVSINRYRQEHGLDNVFRYTNKNVVFMLDIGRNVCVNENAFGNMIDHLYFLFYENLEHIKEFVGNGDKKQGDKKVREEDVYQCIFRVKDIRSDLRHDLEHGSESELQKKRERTASAYNHYALKRPHTPKEFKSFQIMIYKEFAELLIHIYDVVTGDK